MAKEHLNYEQMALTHGHINGLGVNRDVSGLLAHVIDHSPTPVIGRKTGSGHVQLYFKDDGLVVIPSTPKDAHSIGNAESQIRRSLGTHGFEFPTRNQVQKQARKDKKNKKEAAEAPVVEPEQPE
jgi:hypothetical protein